MDTLIASSAAAIFTRLIVYPLDSLKVRVQNSTTPGSRSMLSVLRTTRIHSLYNGIGITLALSTPGLALYLSTYENAKQELSTLFYADGYAREHVIVHALAGTIAECVSGVFWTPMEVIKSKLQVDTAATSPKSTMNLIRHIYRQEGMRGFFRGYFVTLGVFVPQTVIYFTTYEQLKAVSKVHADVVPPFLGYLGSAGIASVFSSSVSNVTDVIKTRIQVSNSLHPEHNSMSSVGMDMYRSEGFRAFTRGMAARVVSIVPATMISMTIFELLKDWFRK